MMRILVKDKNDDNLVLFNVVQAYIDEEDGKPQLFVEVLSDAAIPLLDGNDAQQLAVDTIVMEHNTKILDALLINGYADARNTHFEFVEEEPETLRPLDGKVK